jgi:prolipoprotein diacylglyceryltransferase
MDFPINFHIGTFTIYSHPLFEFLAFAFGYWFYKYTQRKNPTAPFSHDAHWKLLFGMIIGAFLGSRLIAALEDPAMFLYPVSWLYYVGSQTVLGGLVGGILGVEVTKKIIGLKRRTGDVFTFPILFAIMIGRVGCLMTGVSDGTVGLPSSLPWAFDQGDSIPRHPTSAYEIIFALVLFFLLKYLATSKFKQVFREGDLFRLFIIGYGLFRFFVEFIKPIHPLFIGFSSIQLVSLCAVIYYGIYFIRRLSSKRT